MHYHRKIKCPKHFILKAGKSPWKLVPNPLLKNVSEMAIKEFKLRRLVPAVDRYGRKIRDDNNFYQPEVTAGFAIEHCWDPKNPICKYGCRGRCLEGQGVQLESGIKRLSGHYYPGKQKNNNTLVKANFSSMQSAVKR